MTNDQWLNTTDVVTGDTIRFTEAVYEGSFRRPRFLGERIVVAKIVRDSYGATKQQHTFTLEIIQSEGIKPLGSGTITRRKGRNVYRKDVSRLVWDDEAARRQVATEKHQRGDLARMARNERWEETR